jgi:hypothetical protein
VAPEDAALDLSGVAEKWVGRLNLRFDGEKGWLFDSRRAAAIARREKVKALLRYVRRVVWRCIVISLR